MATVLAVVAVAAGAAPPNPPSTSPPGTDPWALSWSNEETLLPGRAPGYQGLFWIRTWRPGLAEVDLGSVLDSLTPPLSPVRRTELMELWQGHVLRMQELYQSGARLAWERAERLAEKSDVDQWAPEYMEAVVAERARLGEWEATTIEDAKGVLMTILSDRSATPAEDDNHAFIVARELHRLLSTGSMRGFARPRVLLFDPFTVAVSRLGVAPSAWLGELAMEHVNTIQPLLRLIGAQGSARAARLYFLRSNDEEMIRRVRSRTALPSSEQAMLMVRELTESAIESIGARHGEEIEARLRSEWDAATLPDSFPDPARGAARCRVVRERAATAPGDHKAELDRLLATTCTELANVEERLRDLGVSRAIQQQCLAGTPADGDTMERSRIELNELRATRTRLNEELRASLAAISAEGVLELPEGDRQATPSGRCPVRGDRG